MNAQHVVFKYRLQKVNLLEKSWWAPEGSSVLSSSPDYHTKATRASCIVCHEESPQVYNEGWACLSPTSTCSRLFYFGGVVQPAQLTFNPVFLSERMEWPPGTMPAYDLIPSAIEDDATNVHHSTSLAAWKGFVCPNCKCCNSRVNWDSEICRNGGCGYTRRRIHPLLSRLSVLPDHTREINGHAFSSNEYRGHIEQPTMDFLGHYRIYTYKLCDGNHITHLLANKHVNGRPGGANDIFLQLQGVGLDLTRPIMRNNKGKFQAPV